MTYISVRVQPLKAQVVRKGLEDLDSEIVLVGRSTLFRATQRIRKRMRVEPLPTPHPYPPAWVKWDGPWVQSFRGKRKKIPGQMRNKQKSAFFATDGFGGGIPHVRTHEYTRGFKMEKLADGTGYTLYNDHPGAKYIGGDSFGYRYSGIHVGLWPLFSVEADIELKQLPVEIQQVLTRVVTDWNNAS